MNVDMLHTLVSSAIWRAQQLAALGVSTASLAWSEVSALEEKLTSLLATTEPEGRIARRGAVRAALMAGNAQRALELVRRFSEEEGASDELRTALREMMEEDADSLAIRYPFAARHHALGEARALARYIHQAGAFGLAA